jgi:hypothetical protein
MFIAGFTYDGNQSITIDLGVPKVLDFLIGKMHNLLL